MKFVLQLTLINILLVLHPSEATLKIVNGSSANIADYPYTALLRIKGHPSCGASFISETTLMTAAHCVVAIDIEDLSFRVGSSDAETGGEILQAKSKIAHEKYCQDLKCLDYDIAVVTVETAPTTVNITSALLAKENSTLAAGTVTTVLGWGNNGTEAFKKLHQVDVPVISQEKCADIYDFANINERMICAGYIEGGKDYCWGDSGGPLIADGVLVGVASWANPCGNANKPGVYVNMAAFRSWIKENTGI